MSNIESEQGKRNKVLPRKASIRSDNNRSNSGSVGIKSKDVKPYHAPLNIRKTDRDYEELVKSVFRKHLENWIEN